MGERWKSGWSPIGLTRRSALRSIGGTVAAIPAVAAGRDDAPRAQEQAEATPATAIVPPDFKVVFHAAEAENWPFVLSNLRNVTRDWPQAQIRVVVDGSAVLGLQGANRLTDELAEIAAKGVAMQVCPNALAEHAIDPATIPPFASTALGGVVALVAAQHEGYAYIKP
jgi:intracellular sulfur oxidation DsrE/DsrF family protein